MYWLQFIISFPPDPVPAPGVTVTRVTSSQVDYETTAHGAGSATRVIAGYEVTRSGVPLQLCANTVMELDCSVVQGMMMPGIFYSCH